MTPKTWTPEAAERLAKAVPEMYYALYWLAYGDTRKSRAEVLANVKRNALKLMERIDGGYPNDDMPRCQIKGE